jgi:putative ABC transport system permease protein
MNPFKGITLRLRALFSTRRVDRDMDDEIRMHLDLETEQYIKLGMSPEEARRRALLAFGGVEATREAHRDARGVSLIEDLLSDVRYAFRTFRRSPVLAGASILTLALGIGANTAIFSAVSAVILRPLPFPDADRLMAMFETNPEYGWVQAQAAPANVLDWQENVTAFEDVAASVDYTTTTTLTGDGEPRLLRSSEVTGNFFSVLGVSAVRGRTFVPKETWNTGPWVAIISDRLWRNHFGADPMLVGRTAQLDGRSVEIVGVMPPSFRFPEENVDVWFPVRWDPAARAQVSFRRAHWVRPVARIRRGVSREEANTQLQVVVDRLSRDYPETNRVMGAGMMPLHDFMVGDTRRPLQILLGSVGLLLLIACANVGNLMLVQARGREREAALRLTLGAARGRLVRQAITESFVVAALGAIAGFVLGTFGTGWLGALQPAGMLPVSEVGMSWTVLWYVVGITTVCALLFGLAPALWNGRRVPGEVLREGGRTGSGGRRMRRWGNVLVVAEVALALPLAVGAGLLVRSFQRLQHVDPGFDGRGVLTMELVLPRARYDRGEKMIDFFRELVDRTRGLPGVTDASAISNLPLTGQSWSSSFAAAGWEPDRYGTQVIHREVTPGYFELMRVPLLRGRTFTDDDGPNAAEAVVVINDRLAQRYFPGEDPIGQRVAFDKTPDSTSFWRTIVGVVGNERQNGLGLETEPEFYAPFYQDWRAGMIVVARSAGDPTTLAPGLRRLVAELDPSLAITSLRTMSQVRAESLARQRFLTMLLSVFAVVGVLLAVIGVYGVMAQIARGRTQEMGIRIALGAQTSQLQWLVVRQGLVVAGVGLAVGIAAALLGAQAMRALLFGVGASDPLTFVAVALLLLATVVAASWIPAIRASRADPMRALRVE